MVAEAQREADEYVAAKRQRAEENADRDVAEVQAEADKRTEKAYLRAEQARAEAEHALARAREQMAEARRMADEAARAAREAADEAGTEPTGWPRRPRSAWARPSGVRRQWTRKAATWPSPLTKVRSSSAR